MVIQTSGGKDLHFKHDKAVCSDGEEKHGLAEHIKKKHHLSPRAYLDKHGHTSTLFGGKVFEKFYSREVERKGNMAQRKCITVGSIDLRARPGKPAARPARPNYHYPKKGKAGRACERVARATKFGNSIYLYGPAGTGKSDLFRTLAHDLNMNFELYPMHENLDPALYIGQMGVVVDEETGQSVTKFVPGRLLLDIQGRIGPDGVRRAVMIGVDDIDRAPAEHHEIFRHILDGAQEIFVPELGKSIPVFEGTTIVATANSRGRGDETGFFSSVKAMDDSMLDRFDRFIEYHYLEEDEEKKILKAKFPYLVNNAPRAFEYVMTICSTLRHMIVNREVHFAFSHRRLTDWLQSIKELVIENGGAFDKKMVGKASLDWLERFDADTRATVVQRTLQAYLPYDLQKDYSFA
jgi:MoxR-like ATPase